MILINPEVHLIQQKELMQGVYEQIELAARTCYKSEGNIKYDSDGNSTTAKDFVNKILNVYKHRSVAEHATIYLTFSKKEPKLNICEDYILKNPYTRYVEDKDNYYITTNYRVIIDNNLESLLWYISKPTEKHNKRTTVRFICSRACAQQLTRHRCASFSMESQRYVSSCTKKNIKDFNCDCVEDICAAYNQGYSAREIALNSSFSESTIFKRLKDNGVTIRGLNARGNIINDYFSNIDSPEKAYLLGIIQTDGSIVNKKGHESLHITQHKDYSWYIKTMLEEFKDNVTDSKDKNCRHLQIGSKQIVSDLISMGIVPNKTYVQTDEDIDNLWVSIPEQYKGDFIRGLIDGDGHVSYFIQNKGINESCNIGFVSIKEHLIDILIEYIHNKFNYRCGKSQDGNIYKLNITDYNKSIEIGKFLYANFKYPFGHPKKASTWISRLGDTYKIANFKDPKFICINPVWEMTPIQKFIFIHLLNDSENSYVKLKLLGGKSQEARMVLPNATKTELVMTAFNDDWNRIFDLRCSDKADDEIRYLCNRVKEII